MDTATRNGPDAALYDRDLNAWCEQQASKLRERSTLGSNDGLDYENLAEEIDALGRSQKNALRSHLVIVILHLLTWQYQPDRRCASWENSIANARAEVAYALEDSPSLRRFLLEAIERAYPIAMRDAETETGLPHGTFPLDCPYSAEQILAPGFLPSDSAT